MRTLLILQIEEQQENLYAKLEGKLTHKDTYQFDHYLIPYIEKKKVRNFICDCQKLHKIDTAGKYALLKMKLTLKKHKGTFLLKDVKENIKKELIGYRMRIQ